MTDLHPTSALADRERLRAVSETCLLDSAAEAAFDRLTRLAGELLNAPIALLSLLDQRRQFVKSAVGLPEPLASRRELALSHSFCQYVVASAAPLMVGDAREHPVLCDNGATREFGFVAYAGIPLMTPDRKVIGTLCVFDRQPRVWESRQLATLKDLAEAAMAEVALRLTRQQLAACRHDAEARSQSEQQLRLTIEELQHKATILESVLDHMTDGVVVVDARGEALLVNPAAKRVLGSGAVLPVEEWSTRYGMFQSDQTTPLSWAAVPLNRALQGEAVDQVEVFVKPEGVATGGWQSVTATPLRTTDGTVWAALSVARDVTRAKQTELALREQAAIIQLLEAVAVAANEASTSRRAMKESLRLVCEFIGWQVGHVYLVDGSKLQPSDLWHVSEPERFAVFREVTSRTHLAAGLDLPGRALATGRAAWMEDVQTDKGFLRARAAGSLGVHGGVAVPVVIGEEVVAVLEFYSDAPAVQDARALDVIHHVGTQLGRVVERERHAEAMRNLSLTDEMTGLNNRRGFLALAQAQLRMCRRASKPASLLFVDVDGLKQINDQLGHEVGDAALLGLADVLRATFRDSDVVARLGGDEFVVLLPETPATEQGAVRRLHEAVAVYNVTHKRPYLLAVSVGLTGFEPHSADSIESLLSRADSLMYEQKKQRKGRPSCVMPP